LRSLIAKGLLGKNISESLCTSVGIVKTVWHSCEVHHTYSKFEGSLCGMQGRYYCCFFCAVYKYSYLLTYHWAYWSIAMTYAFRALTLLVGRQEEPTKKSDEVLVQLFCLQQSANDLHMVQLMPLPPHCLLLH